MAEKFDGRVLSHGETSKGVPIPKPRSSLKRRTIAVSYPERTSSNPTLSQSVTMIATTPIEAVGVSPKRRPGPPPPVRPKPERSSMAHSMGVDHPSSSEEQSCSKNDSEDKMPCSQAPEEDVSLPDIYQREDHFAANASEIEISELSKESGCAMEEFSKICNKILEEIKKLHSSYGMYVIPEALWTETEEFKHVLWKKDIFIGVLGHHNCGKSTFLNAIIGHSILPVDVTNETSVKVKIQHDQNIHPGLCPPNCSQRNQNCCCPELLVVMKDQSRKQMFGPDDICNYLRTMNEQFREAHNNTHEVPSDIILKVNIPLLAASVPSGWTVSLVDNPGFGEAKEHVTQLADISVVTSSAYIYLMQTENIGGTEAAAFFKEVQRIDSKAVVDGRLTIGITKFDQNYERKGDCTKEIKEKVIKSIKDATDSVVTGDMIVPICGEWASVSSQMMSYLMSDSQKHPEMKHLIEKAATCLMKYPNLSLPGGQGQSHLDSLIKYLPKILVGELEMASGMSELKKRVSYVVGKACMKAWVTKVHVHFQNSVACVMNEMPKSISKVQNGYEKCVDDFNSSKRMTDGIIERGRAIRSTVLDDNDEILKEFAEKYATDIEENKAVEAGKEKTRTLIMEFKEALKDKIDKEDLSPQNFEEELQEFLDSSEEKLQAVFESSCGFWNVGQYQLDLKEKAIREIFLLRCDAERLFGSTDTERLRNTPSPTAHQNESEVKEIKDRREFFSAPNLGDIMVQAPDSIPKVSLTWWKKVLQFFRKMWQQDTESVCKPYKEWTDALEKTLKQVQRQMEDACEDYFKDIRSNAIKFFFNDYKSKTLQQLKDFQAEYKTSIRKEEQRLIELKSKIDIKKDGLTKLREEYARIIELQKQLYTAYERFCMEYENSGTGLMNELRVAKKDMKRIKEKTKPRMHFDHMHY